MSTVPATVAHKFLRRAEQEEVLAFAHKKEFESLVHCIDRGKVQLRYAIEKRYQERFNSPQDTRNFKIAKTNTHKNRSDENHPADDAILDLTSRGVSYINASTVNHGDTTYLATQHPMEHTVHDFWHMILAEKPSVIVMLNKADFDKEQQEGPRPGDPPLIQYWPDADSALVMEDPSTGSVIQVRVLPDHDPETAFAAALPRISCDAESPPAPTLPPPVATQATEQHQGSPYPVPVLPDSGSLSKAGSSAPQSAIEVSRYLVEHRGATGDLLDAHPIWHIRCGNWEDQTAPDADLFLGLWQVVHEKMTEIDGKYKIVIHCKGGVGRTGTFIAIDIASKQLKSTLSSSSGSLEEFSIDKIIHFLREKRMNMIGCDAQYVFCHKAALHLDQADTDGR